MADFPAPGDLRRQVEAIRELATLPHVMSRLLEIVVGDDASATDVSELIATDTSLTARILKIVNSAFYGFPRRIGLISEAVVILGFNEVQRISLAATVVGMFGPGGAQNTRRMHFWTHSFDTAAMAELLERSLGRGEQGAFTAGILHDLGRATMDQYFPEFYQAVWQNERETQRPAVVVEQELLRCTHADIGSWLAECWHLPETLVEAIRNHHAPDRSHNNLLPAAVHVADALVHRLNDADSEEIARRPVSPAALELLHMDPVDLDPLMAEFSSRFAGEDPLIGDLLSPTPPAA